MREARACELGKDVHAPVEKLGWSRARKACWLHGDVGGMSLLTHPGPSPPQAAAQTPAGVCPVDPAEWLIATLPLGHRGEAVVSACAKPVPAAPQVCAASPSGSSSGN